MPGQNLAEDALAFVAGTGDRLERILAGIVHHIERHIEHLGQTNSAVGRLALDRRRARQGVAFGAGDALGQQLLLQMRDQLAVLGMDGADGAQLAGPGEAVHQDLVIGHDGALIGHEVLERVDPVLGGQGLHGFMNAVVPPGDGDMEAVIGGRFLGPAAPRLVGLQDVVLGAGDDEVDDHRGAATGRRGGARKEIFRCHRAHEGQFHMSVRIDAAGHHVAAAGVDHFSPRGHIECLADGDDRAALAEHIGPRGALGGNHGAAPDV